MPISGKNDPRERFLAAGGLNPRIIPPGRMPIDLWHPESRIAAGKASDAFCSLRIIGIDHG